MAAKNLISRKSVEKDKVFRNSKGQQILKCPIFSVHYLGKMPARGEYGREFISEPVEALLKLKDRHKSPKKSALQITEKGFHFLDFNGAFGKEKHVLIPIHHICYGVADEQNPKVFAIITRTDSNPENSLFECHAFHCEKKKEASEITYWLLRTFLEVFEDLQRRRRIRQERKMFRQQTAGMLSGNAGPAFSVSPPTSPTESNSPMTMYSVILDGSKTKGAAVRLARKSSKHRPVSFPPAPGLHTEADASPSLNGFTSTRDVYNVAGPTMAYAQQGPGMKKPESKVDVQGRPNHLEHHIVRQYDHRGGIDVTERRDPYTKRTNHTTNTSDEHRGNFNHGGPRYSKNPQLPRSRSSTSANTSSTDESFSGVSREEADFLFIEMLQEEFGGLEPSPTPAASGVPRRVNKKPTKTGPPDQKLRSEDIEKRIREWLEYDEEGDDGEAVFSPLKSPSTHGSPATIRSPAGYNPGYIYQNVGYRDDSQSTHGSRASVASASDKDYF